MVYVRRKRGWELPESAATPERDYRNRRQFLKSMGVAAIGTAGLVYGARAAGEDELTQRLRQLRKLEVSRNAEYAVEREITAERVAATYNNFYEFSRDKDDVWQLAGDFQPRPWTLEVGGLVNRPRTFDVDELVRRMPVEERVYRLRCVEAWSMVVPWVGFPLSALLREVEPNSRARYVKFTTFMDPEVAPRQAEEGWFSSEPWPYTEGLSLPEAMNELTLMTVGIYGHVLPAQHGAPIRLITPWKYGFKSIKSVVRIELTEQRPETFWHTLVPSEYGFVSNVNPNVPHPRWSQAHERVIGSGERIPTQLYNGYGESVAHLYKQA